MTSQKAEPWNIETAQKRKWCKVTYFIIYKTDNPDVTISFNESLGYILKTYTFKN